LVGNISIDEIELLNAYNYLNSNCKNHLKDYMRYLLCKQYRREVTEGVFHNQLLQNLLHGLLYIVERDDFDVHQVRKRVKHIKELYYGIFEQIHYRYIQVVSDLDTNETVREFGKNSFDNLERVLNGNDINSIRMEIIDFFQEYTKLAKKHYSRKIVAV
jgi:hypothetical protein